VKVVLDTNVLVSAVLTAHGTCARIIDLLVDGTFSLLADDRILAEYTDVLQRPELHLVPEDVAVLLELVRSSADTIATTPLPARLPDPAGTPFLEVATASQSLLITGNTRHYPKGSRAGVTVLTPAEFLELFRTV
jgi:putative PIN family toxin of toxin-antitoxin system